MHLRLLVNIAATIGCLVVAVPAAHSQGMAPAANAPALPAPPKVALDEVAIRAQPRPLTLRAPGEAQGLNDAIAWSLTPTERLAVWYALPDSGHAYRVRAVRVRLGSRMPTSMVDLARHRRNFTEGRLALRLSPATPAGTPAETNLLAAPLLLTAEAPEQQRDGWVRFDVADQRLVLPVQGVFVIAEGLTQPDEQFVRSRVLIRPVDGRTPPEDVTRQNRRPAGKSTPIFQYEEVQPAGGGASRLVLSNAFPAVAHRSVRTAAECQSWQWRTGPRGGWKALALQNAEFRQYGGKAASIVDYNYDLVLEVEEL